MQNIRLQFAICTLSRWLGERDRGRKTFLNAPDCNVAQLKTCMTRTGIACQLCCDHSLCMKCDGRANLEVREWVRASAVVAEA